MTINHLKNKKYHILISLFYIGYALGAQEVKAADNPSENKPKTNDYTLTYTISDEHGDDKKYQIEDFQHIDQIYKATAKNANFDIFRGTNHQKSPAETYIFIAHTPLSTQSQQGNNTEQAGKRQVKGYKLTIDEAKKKHQMKSMGHSPATLIAYHKSWLWGSSFIFNYKDAKLAFYYRQGWSGGEVIEVEMYEENNSLYKTKSTPIQIWEIEKPKSAKSKSSASTNSLNKGHGHSSQRTPYIVATWHVKESDTFNANATSHGWCYSTLMPNDSAARPYIKLHYLNISYIAIVLAIAYAIFHKAINKKVMQLVHKHILSKEVNE